jgi:hypothetical protein
VDDIGFPPAPAEGAQAAFIRGTGSLETTVDFGAGGFYAVRFAWPVARTRSIRSI